MRASTIQSALTLALLAVLTYGLLVPGHGVLALPNAAGVDSTPLLGGTPPGGTPRPGRSVLTTPVPGEGGTPAASPAVATPASSASPMIVGTPGTPVRSATPIVARVSAGIHRDLSPLSFTLTGRAQVVRTTIEIDVLAVAPVARQPGWHLTLSMEQFRAVEKSSRTLPGDAVTLVDVSVRCVSATGCSDSQNRVSYPRGLSAGKAATVYGAEAGSGNGQFIVTLTFEVEVPANASAGIYGTSIEVGIASGR